MIITQTPVRVSLFGGGTDFPEWYAKNGGLCVGMAIDRYSYVWLKRLPAFFDYDIKLSYSIIEHLSALDDIKHNAIRECFRQFGISSDIELHYTSEMPAQSGIGSSSTFVVGLIHALRIMSGIRKDAKDIAIQTNILERMVLNEPGGYQDAIWAAYGGLNEIHFLPSTSNEIESFEVKPIKVAYEDYGYLSNSLVLVYTKQAREKRSGEVTATYKKKDSDNLALMQIAESGAEAVRCLDVKTIGKLLNDNWTHKKAASEHITTGPLDELRDFGLSNGALGAKLLGAGGGGCMLFVVHPEKRHEFVDKMRDVVVIDFNIDFQGTKQIL